MSIYVRYTCTILFFIRTILKEHQGSKWLKIKNKLRTIPELIKQGKI